MIKPQVGQIVGYTLDNRFPAAGEIRPAIIVKVHSEASVNLMLFPDGDNDGHQGRVGVEQRIPYWLTSTMQGNPGLWDTWHFLNSSHSHDGD